MLAPSLPLKKIESPAVRLACIHHKANSANRNAGNALASVHFIKFVKSNKWWIAWERIQSLGVAAQLLHGGRHAAPGFHLVAVAFRAVGLAHDRHEGVVQDVSKRIGVSIWYI